MDWLCQPVRSFPPSAFAWVFLLYSVPVCRVACSVGTSRVPPPRARCYSVRCLAPVPSFPAGLAQDPLLVLVPCAFLTPVPPLPFTLGLLIVWLRSSTSGPPVSSFRPYRPLVSSTRYTLPSGLRSPCLWPFPNIASLNSFLGLGFEDACLLPRCRGSFFRVSAFCSAHRALYLFLPSVFGPLLGLTRRLSRYLAFVFPQLGFYRSF